VTGDRRQKQEIEVGGQGLQFLICNSTRTNSQVGKVGKRSAPPPEGKTLLEMKYGGAHGVAPLQR
jgi:hypothetical protein